MNRVVQTHSTDTFHTKTGSPCNILCTSLRSSGINAIPPWEAYSKRCPKYRCMGSRVLCQISAWEYIFHPMELVSYASYFFLIFLEFYLLPQWQSVRVACNEPPGHSSPENYCTRSNARHTSLRFETTNIHIFLHISSHFTCRKTTGWSSDEAKMP